MRAAWLLAGAAPAVLAAACSKLAEEDPRDTCPSAPCPPCSVAWVLRAESLTRTTVTAVAPSPGEPPWFAGGYSGDLRIDTADFTFLDPGPHDGFADRVDGV